jgi:glutamyl-tRNA reductase
MLKIGLVGASLHEAPLELLSALTIPKHDRKERLRDLARAAGFSELVYMATCNRVEFVFETTEDRPIHESRNQILDFFFYGRKDIHFSPENFYSHNGIEAARHLFTVTSALDSLVIGEAQILGQVKESWSEAQDNGLAGEELLPAFQSAFRCAKRVRRETEIGARKLSMVSLAAEVIKEFRHEVSSARVAIIGSGAMACKLAEAVTASGGGEILFVNRTVAKIEEMAKKSNCNVMDLESFLANPPAVDAVFTSTAAPEAIITRERAERLLAADNPTRPMLFIDLAIPRDVSDDVEDIPNVRLWHLGTLRDLANKNRRERFRAADRAREIVNEEVLRYHGEVVEAVLSPLFEDTQAKADMFARAGLESLLEGRLEHLSETDKEAVRYWVIKKLIPGVVHLPLKALAKSAGTHGMSSAKTDGDGPLQVESDGVRVHGVKFAPPRC